MDSTASIRAPFVVNVDDGRWLGNGQHAFITPEAQGDSDERFEQFGLSVDVLQPGAGASYHRELWDDESFLVLSGECDLVIEGELHRIDGGTFIHCPAGTAHVFVGAGDEPCQLVMFGARGNVPDGEAWGEYVPDPHAARLGVSVAERTSDPKVAYAGRPTYGQVDPPMPFTLDRSSRTRRSTHGDGTNGSAKLVDGPFGSLVPSTDGWFILHLDDALWVDNEGTASAWIQGRCDDLFQQYGVNVRVARPGAPVCAYHREKHFDEAFLVLDGAGVLLVEGEELPVRAGDLFWCPRGTGHVFVGGTDEPLVLLLVGTRDFALEQSDPESLEYPVDELALRHGAGVTAATFVPEVAYADWRDSEPTSTPPWRWRTR